MSFPVEKCHFQSKNIISGPNMSFPVEKAPFTDEKCRLRSENIISGQKCYFRSEHVISGPNMSFPVRTCHFRSVNVISGRKSFILGLKIAVSGRKMSFPVGKRANYFKKYHPICNHYIDKNLLH